MNGGPFQIHDWKKQRHYPAWKSGTEFAIEMLLMHLLKLSTEGHSL